MEVSPPVCWNRMVGCGREQGGTETGPGVQGDLGSPVPHTEPIGCRNITVAESDLRVSGCHGET